MLLVYRTLSTILPEQLIHVLFLNHYDIRESVDITRLRVVHKSLTHVHRLGKGRPPTYDVCGDVPSVDYILAERPSLQRSRNNFGMTFICNACHYKYCLYIVF